MIKYVVCLILNICYLPVVISRNIQVVLLAPFKAKWCALHIVALCLRNVKGQRLCVVSITSVWLLILINITWCLRAVFLVKMKKVTSWALFWTLWLITPVRETGCQYITLRAPSPDLKIGPPHTSLCVRERMWFMTSERDLKTSESVCELWLDPVIPSV